MKYLVLKDETMKELIIKLWPIFLIIFTIIILWIWDVIDDHKLSRKPKGILKVNKKLTDAEIEDFKKAWRDNFISDNSKHLGY